MTTPLEPYSNSRIEFIANAGRGGPEVGYRTLPGQRYLVLAFLKNETTRYRSDFKATSDIRLSTVYLEGYITGFCPLPEISNYETFPYADEANYDSTGFRPPGFRPPEEIELIHGDIKYKSAELLASEGVFGDQGIGDRVRRTIGDRILIKAERW